MKKRENFDIKKCLYGENPVYISGLLDPFTARIARFFYNLGFSANLTTAISFVLGISSIIAMFVWNNYFGLVLAAILLTLRNIGDTVDGKIARGSNTTSPVGGFSDIVSDWIFFHAAFFVAIGILTNNIFVGFLCVTGYMSREFARRMFEKKYGIKTKDTSESKKISGIVSLVTKYDLANVFWITPIFLLLNHPEIVIYGVAIIEYTLLIGELAFDYYCFLKKNKK